MLNKINFVHRDTPRGRHITAIIPVFQTGDTGSTPVARSNKITPIYGGNFIIPYTGRRTGKWKET